MMDAVLKESLLNILQQRRSIRRYVDQPVVYADLLEICRLARCAPSGANLQPGKLYILNKIPLAGLSAALIDAYRNNQVSEEEYSYFPTPLPEHLRNRQHELGWRLYNSLGIGRRDIVGRRQQHERNFRFFDAPVGIIVTIERGLGAGCFMDMGMFLQNFFLAAESFNYATTGIGALASYHKIIRNELGINDNEVIVCGIALGVADRAAAENNFPVPRAELDEYIDLSRFS